MAENWYWCQHNYFWQSKHVITPIMFWLDYVPYLQPWDLKILKTTWWFFPRKIRFLETLFAEFWWLWRNEDKIYMHCSSFITLITLSITFNSKKRIGYRSLASSDFLQFSFYFHFVLRIFACALVEDSACHCSRIVPTAERVHYNQLKLQIQSLHLMRLKKNSLSLGYFSQKQVVITKRKRSWHPGRKPGSVLCPQTFLQCSFLNCMEVTGGVQGIGHW